MKNFVYIILLLIAVSSSARVYKAKEKVSVFVSNAGPFDNPAETYDFYEKLPYCIPPHEDREMTRTFTQSLMGERQTNSQYDILFLEEISSKTLCSQILSTKEVQLFMNAILEDYMFQFFIDDLPIEGYIGEFQSLIARDPTGQLKNITKLYLYKHLHFSFLYNQDQIIAVNVTTFPNTLLDLNMDKVTSDGLQIDFTYSTHWSPTNIPFSERNHVHSLAYAHPAPLSVQVHWLSIFNTFVLVLLLTALLAVILLRVLKRDLDIDEIGDDKEDTGWKKIHDNVFRFPEYPMIFSAMIGTGVQIFCIVFGLLFLSSFGSFNPGSRGSVYIASLLFYAFTAGIAGFVSARFYTQLGGKKWANNAVLTACVFALPFFFTWSVVNSVALNFNTTSSLPFSAVAIVFLLWAFITFPLTLIGANIGRRLAGEFDAPCKTKVAKREIPEQANSWFRSIPVQMLVTGFLPFSAIYIEVHYLFAAIWGHHVYTFFGVLCVAFILLWIVSSVLTVCLTYLQLSVEDWRWWWRSFLSGGATGCFICCYGAFYYFMRSSMHGTLQATFFFGYMFMVAYAFFLMLGALGFFSSLRFVRYIYGAIKVE